MSAPAAAEDVRVPVYVWDLVVRLAHWLIFGSIVVLSVTGFYIGRPFVTASPPGFFTGWVRVVHFYASIVFAVAVAARIVWMFIGSKYARWRQFFPIEKQRRRDLIGTLKFYMFLKPEPPPAVGHNAVAGLAYVAVFGLFIVEIATGLALYGASVYAGSYMHVFGAILPIVGGAQTARWVHHVIMYLIIGFAVQHVYSSILMSRVEKNGGIDSIFSGWKSVPKT